MTSVPLDAAPQRPARRALPTPLLWPAVGLILGIVVDNELQPPRWAALIVLAAGAMAGFTVRSSPQFRTTAVIAACAAVGALRHDLALRRWPADHVSRFVGATRIMASLRGTLRHAPEIYQPQNPWPSTTQPGTPHTRLLIDVDAIIDAAGVERPASGLALVYVSHPLGDLLPDDRLQVFGFLSRVRGPNNPGEFDRRLWLARDGILVTLSANTVEAVQRLSRPVSSTPRRWLHELRRRMSSALRETGSGAMDDRIGSVLDALVLAQRSDVDRAINEAFVRTGTSHFLAASGMNVAWLALLVWLIAQPLGLHYRTIACMVAAVVLLYGLLAEPNPPILRAVLMALLACASLVLRSRVNLLNWLATSAIIILTFNPGVLFGASFQLSFLAILGILCIAPRLHWSIRNAFGRSPPDLDLQLLRIDPWAWADSDHSRIHTLRSMLWTAVLVSVAAWMSALPLLAGTFGTVAPLGFLTTLLLAPWVLVITSLGFVTMVLAVIWPRAAVLTGPLLDQLSTGLIATVEWLAEFPGHVITLSRSGTAWIMAFYAIIAAWTILPRHRVPRWVLPCAACLLTAWPFVPPLASWRPSNVLTVSTLAVGNGTATVIELPDGRTLLYDCGSRGSSNVAGRVVLPFLQQRGIRRIDAAIVSHPDADHYSALLEVHEFVPISRLIINEHFDSLAVDQPEALVMIFESEMRGIVVQRVATGWTYDGTSCSDNQSACIEAIWPPGGIGFVPGDNDSSTVVRVSYAGHSMLLTGDIEEYAMTRLLGRDRHAPPSEQDAPASETVATRDAPIDLRCDVLQLPHHGAVVRSTHDFIEATGANTFIRSSADPDEETTNGLTELMRTRSYFNTADRGCVFVELSAQGATVRTWL